MLNSDGPQSFLSGLLVTRQMPLFYIMVTSKNLKNSFFLCEKVGMLDLKSSGYAIHPDPNPKGETIIRGSLLMTGWFFFR